MENLFVLFVSERLKGLNMWRGYCIVFRMVLFEIVRMRLRVN